MIPPELPHLPTSLDFQFPINVSSTKTSATWWQSNSKACKSGSSNPALPPSSKPKCPAQPQKYIRTKKSIEALGNFKHDLYRFVTFSSIGGLLYQPVCRMLSVNSGNMMVNILADRFNTEKEALGGTTEKTNVFPIPEVSDPCIITWRNQIPCFGGP